MKTAIALLVVLVLVAACGQQLPLPMTATQLNQQKSVPALIAYLGQPDASASVCDLPPRAPNVPLSIPSDFREALVDALGVGQITPPLWSACVDRMLQTAERASVALLVDDVAKSYGRALTDRKLETDDASKARLEAMEAVVLDAPPARRPDPDVAAELLSTVREALSQQRLGPWAARHVAAVVDAFDLEQGRLHGGVVDQSTLDKLLAAGDETLLLRASLRLPTPDLRAEARRRVIRLRINASPDPALRADATAVEETVMRDGVNRVSLRAHPPLRARLAFPARRALVRQQVLQRTAVLLGTAEQRADISVLPELPLRHALQADLNGLTRPVTICGPATALDPEPCIAADELTVESPLVTRDRDGVLRFVEHLTASELTRLAQDEQLVVPIDLSGKRVASLAWPLTFEKPADLTLQGSPRGPDLRIDVARAAAGRLVETVHTAHETYVAVVEKANAPRFRITSRGPDGSSGMSGQRGADGSDGLSGSIASCPSSPGTSGDPGRDGSSGGDGADGGDGGNGGNIQVEVACGGAPCADLLSILKTTVVSVGGSGGPGGVGGDGGRGGRGGMGGSGTSCTSDDGTSTSLASGSDGFGGHDGMSGHSGRDGSPGGAGSVSVRVERQDARVATSKL